MYRIVAPILAVLAWFALDCGSIAAQDVWQLAIEDLPPLDFPDSPGGAASQPSGASKPSRLPPPAAAGGDLRPEDVGDLKPEDVVDIDRQAPSGATRDASTDSSPATNRPPANGDTATEEIPEEWAGPGELYEDTVDHRIRDFLVPVFSSGDWYRQGHWYVDAKAAGIWRSIGKPKVLARDLSSVNGIITGGATRDITTRHKGFRFEPGLGLTLGRFLGRDTFNRDASVEFSFLGLFDWQTNLLLNSAAENELFTAINLDGPGGSKTSSTGVPLGFILIPGFDAVDQHSFEYSSDFNSFELNVRLAHRVGRDRMVAMPDGTWTRQLASGGVPSFFAGLRYIGIEERLLWQSRENGSPIPTGTYDVQTHNALVGLQFGGNYKWTTKTWSAGAGGKAGAYINFADMRRQINGIGQPENLLPTAPLTAYQYATNLPNLQPTPPFPAAANVFWNHEDVQRGSVYAAFLETEMFAQYNVNPNLSFRFAWEQFWINGLAMAPYQLTFEPARAKINIGGNVYFTGLSLTGQWVW